MGITQVTMENLGKKIMVVESLLVHTPKGVSLANMQKTSECQIYSIAVVEAVQYIFFTSAK